MGLSQLVDSSFRQSIEIIEWGIMNRIPSKLVRYL
jgi:hypothetical protein